MVPSVFEANQLEGKGLLSPDRMNYWLFAKRLMRVEDWQLILSLFQNAHTRLLFV